MIRGVSQKRGALDTVSVRSKYGVETAILDLLNMEALPRFLFEEIASSNSLIEGSSALVLSRSLMNSLKA